MSQQFKQLEDRISRLESDLAQLAQRVAAPVVVPIAAPVEVPAPDAEPVRRGPGRPKKEQQ